MIQINHDGGEGEVGETAHGDSVARHVVHDNHALSAGVLKIRRFNVEVARITVGCKAASHGDANAAVEAAGLKRRTSIVII